MAKLVNVVIEPGNLHSSIIVDQSRQHFAKCVSRVGDGAAEPARVQISIGTGQVDLKVSDPLEPISNRRLTGSILRAIADHRDIGREFFFDWNVFVVFASQESRQSCAARFLFAFDQEFDLDRQVAFGLQVRFDSKHVSDHLAFVIRCPASVDFAIAHAGLKRRRLPQLVGIRRLDIVVPVNQNRGGTLDFGRFGIN